MDELQQVLIVNENNIDEVAEILDKAGIEYSIEDNLAIALIKEMIEIKAGEAEYCDVIPGHIINYYANNINNIEHTWDQLENSCEDAVEELKNKQQ